MKEVKTVGPRAIVGFFLISYSFMERQISSAQKAKIAGITKAKGSAPDYTLVAVSDDTPLAGRAALVRSALASPASTSSCAADSAKSSFADVASRRICWTHASVIAL